jgi:hypothetical protein
MPRFSLSRSVLRYTERYLDNRRRARVERALDALPHDIRKDIGWPDRWTERTSRS